LFAKMAADPPRLSNLSIYLFTDLGLLWRFAFVFHQVCISIIASTSEANRAATKKNRVQNVAPVQKFTELLKFTPRIVRNDANQVSPFTHLTPFCAFKDNKVINNLVTMS
jgi:hypothetical protein